MREPIHAVKIGNAYFVETYPDHCIISRAFATQGEADAELARIEAWHEQREPRNRAFALRLRAGERVPQTQD